MKLRPYLGVLSFTLMILSFHSCTVDEQIVSLKPSSDDLALQEALTNITGEPDNFILPDSDDFLQIPADPKNKLTKEKVLLGQLLFHETGLAVKPKDVSAMGTYSCASCHHSAAGFQSGMKQGIGDGGQGFGLFGELRSLSPEYTPEMIDVQPIRSPSILNSAYQKVMLWNGQFGATGVNSGTNSNWTIDTPKEKNYLGFEGVETQAIAGLEVHRMGIDKEFCDTYGYTQLFDQAFPDVHLKVRYSLKTAGLAIAAYERTVLANQSNFQKWLKGDTQAMSSEEKKGALIFFGKGECFKCHKGPALNAEEFHSLGMKDLSGPTVHGIVDTATKKGRGGFTGNSNDDYKFKVPQLYNLQDGVFLGHGASFNSIKEIVIYKNAARKENFNIPDSQLSEEFKPLNLNLDEINQLALFLEKSLRDNNLNRYLPERTLTGNCFPNSDSTSMKDLNCGN